MEALCRDFRLHEEEELTKLGARTLYLNMPKVEMTNRVCSGYCKTAKRLTSHEVKVHSELPERTVTKLWLPNSM